MSVHIELCAFLCANFKLLWHNQITIAFLSYWIGSFCLQRVQKCLHTCGFDVISNILADVENLCKVNQLVLLEFFCSFSWMGLIIFRYES